MVGLVLTIARSAGFNINGGLATNSATPVSNPQQPSGVSSQPIAPPKVENEIQHISSSGQAPQPPLSDGQKRMAQLGASVVSSATMPPLVQWADNIRVDQMLQKDGPGRSMLGSARVLIQSGGVRGFLFAGIGPEFIAATYKRTIKQATYMALVGADLSRRDIEFKTTSDGKAQLTPVQLAILNLKVGFVAGTVEGVAVNPPEVIKTQLQAAAQKPIESRLPHERSAVAMARHIVASEGLKGLYKGYPATFWRNGGSWTPVYYVLQDAVVPSVKSALRSVIGDHADTKGGILFVNVVGGFVAGAGATLTNTPFDMVRTRLQAGQGSSNSIVKGIVVDVPNTLVDVAKEQGVRGLYRGLAPKMLMLGVVGAAMKVVTPFVEDQIVRSMESVD